MPFHRSLSASRLQVSLRAPDQPRIIVPSPFWLHVVSPEVHSTDEILLGSGASSAILHRWHSPTLGSSSMPVYSSAGDVADYLDGESVTQGDDSMYLVLPQATLLETETPGICK
jgi:hypothetical protein